jgi:integrase
MRIPIIDGLRVVSNSPAVPRQQSAAAVSFPISGRFWHSAAAWRSRTMSALAGRADITEAFFRQRSRSPFGAARKIIEAGGSLRDVQELAGHRSLQTTQLYIAGSSDAKKR